MRKQHELTAFRKFPNGEVIALFVQNKWSYGGKYICSYMHVGQHGDACPELEAELDRATSEEYNALKEELESIGYRIEVKND